MFQPNGTFYQFHHLGLPTNKVRPNERYGAQVGLYTSEIDCTFATLQ